MVDRTELDLPRPILNPSILLEDFAQTLELLLRNRQCESGTWAVGPSPRQGVYQAWARVDRSLPDA